MIICVCNRVSDRDIARAVSEGCETFDELQFETGVATCCGCCHDCAKQTFEQHLSARASVVSVLVPLPAAAPVEGARAVMHRGVARAASSAFASAA